MTTSTALIEPRADESTGISDPNPAADWGSNVREIPRRTDIWREIAAVDASLARIAHAAGVDLDALCEAASRAFDPAHRPGDPIHYTDEDILKVVDAELRAYPF